MAEEAPSPLDLDSPQSQRLHRREWHAERIGWLFIAGLLVAGGLGLLGPGPLSHRTKASADGRLSVEYFSLLRSESPATLRIRVQPVPGADHIRLTLSQRFIDQTVPDAILPQPAWMEIEDTRIVLFIRAADLQRSGVVTYRYRCDEFGALDYQIEADGSVIDVSQFIFP